MNDSTVTLQDPIPLKIQRWAITKLLRERRDLSAEKVEELCDFLATLTWQIAAGRLH